MLKLITVCSLVATSHAMRGGAGGARMAGINAARRNANRRQQQQEKYVIGGAYDSCEPRTCLFGGSGHSCKQEELVFDDKKDAIKTAKRKFVELTNDHIIHDCACGKITASRFGVGMALVNNPKSSRPSTYGGDLLGACFKATATWQVWDSVETKWNRGSCNEVSSKHPSWIKTKSLRSAKSLCACYAFAPDPHFTRRAPPPTADELKAMAAQNAGSSFDDCVWAGANGLSKSAL